MLSKTKNIIIFLAIAVVLVLVYVFFIKKAPEETNLLSSSSQTNDTSDKTVDTLDKDFLPFLLNVKNIKLDDSIFTDPAFLVLIDSNIVLIPEGNEGRSNPFAVFGVENKVDTGANSSSSQSN